MPESIGAFCLPRIFGSWASRNQIIGYNVEVPFSLTCLSDNATKRVKFQNKSVALLSVLPCGSWRRSNAENRPTPKGYIKLYATESTDYFFVPIISSSRRLISARMCLAQVRYVDIELDWPHDESSGTESTCYGRPKYISDES